jgi:GNAT superfamily N-acetyltransferase
MELDTRQERSKTSLWHGPRWIAGRWRLVEGRPADYKSLARWHYLAGPPATWCKVATVRHERPGVPGDVVAAVAVLSWPTICSRGRNATFDLGPMSYGEKARWANANVRTISRVVVRPGYRGCGLAGVVIQRLIELCPTPIVESTARMGQFHPMFERCGMTRVEVAGSAPYFWRRVDDGPETVKVPLKVAPAAAGAWRTG